MNVLMFLKGLKTLLLGLEQSRIKREFGHSLGSVGGKRGGAIG